MIETMVDVCASMQEQKQTATTRAAPQPPRRPRVREVSSRFMSPVVSSSSSGDLHLPASKCPLPKHAVSISSEFHSRQQQRSQSVQRQHPELEPLCCSNMNIPETIRSLETPLGSQSEVVNYLQGKQRDVKLFKENGGSGEQQHPDPTHSKTLNRGKLPGRRANLSISRSDTPTVHSLDRMTSRSIFSSPNFQRSANIGVVSVATTAAAKLVQSSGMGAHPKVPGGSFEFATSIPVNSSPLDDDDTGRAERSTSDSSQTEKSTIIGQGGICSSRPISSQNCKTRSLPYFRSSMMEADLLPTMSARLLAERNCISGDVIGGDSSKASASPCHRSLNSPLSSCENSLFSPIKSVQKSSVSSKPYTSSVKTGSLCLPPQPSNTKLGIEARKGRKVSSHQDDVHALRMLHDRYLQWRYANAKAEASMHAKRSAAERTLYALGVKISELHDSVERKRTKLVQLKRTDALSTILEAQLPYLDEWSALEEDYSSSLSGATKALQDASLRLPIVGNVRADILEVGEALNSASNVMGMMSYIGSFLPKVEETGNLISELARVVGEEKALIEECGYLLSKTHMLQVDECSLRGHLIQLNRSSYCQPKEEVQA